MIQTTINYACDVEGCDSVAETKDVMSMGFGGIPKGWAAINWIAEVMPEGQERSEAMKRFHLAMKKLNKHVPPEVVEYNEAARQLFVENQDAQLRPRHVSCKAIVCDKCLDKINLGTFDANGSNALFSA